MNAEALAALKPTFKRRCVVTAGATSPPTDGAAAVLVFSEDYVTAHGLKALARVRSRAIAGVEAEIMVIGPFPPH